MTTSDKNLSSIKSRLLLVEILIAIIFVLLSIYLYDIINNNNQEYNRIVLSQKQNNFDTKTIQARRGDILDSNGNVLARSMKVYNLIIDARLITSDEKNRYIDPTVDALNNVFGFERGELYDIINRKKNSAYVKYKKEMSFDEKNKFEKYTNDKNREYQKNDKIDRIRGIWFEEEYKRYYTYDSIASNVIGFTSNDGKDGVMGLEAFYNDELSGINGRKYGYLNEEYNLESIVKPEVDGNNIVTTLNINIQQTVEKYLKKWQKDDVGSKKAACIVMNPNNGEILAMAGTNSFNLNNPRDLSMFTDEEILNVGKEEAVKRYNKQYNANITIDQIGSFYNIENIMALGREILLYQNWKNICVQDTFEPGSTSKVVTVSGAYEENLVNENTHFLCEGKINLSDGENSWTIRCNNRSGHGDLNLEETLMYSCNMSMANMAEMMGIENFCKYFEIFGFGEKTNIDLPYEADTEKLVYNKDNMGRTALATNAFGQNFNCTMIQMATAYASIINGGNYFVPHIVKRIENNNGTLLSELGNKTIRRTISTKTANFIKDALFLTVEKGTGKAAQIDGFNVGGKTGTAEKLPRENKNYLVSFCGFAPAENPELLVYVIVDEPNLVGEAQAKASFATNIFKNIMSESLAYLNVKTDLYNSINSSKSLLEGIQVATLGNAVKIDFNNKNESAFDSKKYNASNKNLSKITDETILSDKKNVGLDAPGLLPIE